MSRERWPDIDPRFERIAEAFEALQPHTLDDLACRYAPDAGFKDPFQTLQGRAAIRALFAHMFDALQEPRFEVVLVVAQANTAFMTWNLRFRLARWGQQIHCIHGASQLRLNPAGQIEWHRDYWDAAEELYEKVPILRGLMRWLRRRAAAPSSGSR